MGFPAAKEGKVGSVRNRMQTVLSTMKEGMRRKCAVRVSPESVQPSRCFDGLFTFSPLGYLRRQAASSNSIILWLLQGLSEYRQHLLSTVLWWVRSHVLWFPSALDEIRGAIVSQHPTIADPVTRLSRLRLGRCTTRRERRLRS